ncbi:MAG: S8 family peptidase [Clostridia bacterium]
MSVFDKLDSILLSTIAMDLSEEKKIDCIVFAKNYGFAKRFLMQKNEIEIVKYFHFISAFGVRVNKDSLINLANCSYIDYVSSEAKVTSLMEKSKKILRVDTLHSAGVLGKNVGICYIDTGISPHLDFTLACNRISGFVDLVHGRKNAYDDNGHGTSVAGAGSGSGLRSNGRFCGIAPLSNIFSIKALDNKGETGAMRILQAMEWVYNNHVTCGIKVVCMSFGSEPIGVLDPIMQGAESLWNDGVCVVAAAGNSGPNFGTVKSPAVSRKIISVGGLDDGRSSNKTPKIADFSSRGPAFGRMKPDVIAPAVNINSCSLDKKIPYSQSSGTSIATPMVAGLACLLLEKNPNLPPDGVKRIITSSASPIVFSKMEEGYGLPSAEKCFVFN